MPGTDGKILSRTKMRRERLLPVPGDVLVKKGERVQPGTILARAEVLPGDPYVIDLQSELRRILTPTEVSKAMLKRIGERVKAGEPIAQVTRGRFSEVIQALAPIDGTIEFISRAYARVLLREDPKSAAPVAVVPVAKQLDVWPSTLRLYMRYREGDEVVQGAALADSPGIGGLDYSYAPISGIIEKIDTRTGHVTIIRPARTTMVEAYLSGEIEEVIPEMGAIVSCEAAYIQGVFGVGFESHGYLRVINGSDDGKVTSADLSGQLRDHVLVLSGYASLEVVQKAAAGGAAGLVAGGMDHMDLVKYVGSEIGVGITGQEDVPMSIVLTEGFGEMPMAKWTFELLCEHQGKLASLNGSTQVRAGVIRPEVVIPLGPLPEDEIPEEAATPQPPPSKPEPGRLARVLRKPYLGLWGEIVEVPDAPEQLETEVRVRVVRLRLEDGRDVTVPLANLELF